jgi:hypothetical protein
MIIVVVIIAIPIAVVARRRGAGTRPAIPGRFLWDATSAVE